MRKIILLLIALLSVLPIVSATDITLVNKPMLLWANFGLNQSIVNITSANITITDPNLVRVVTNQAMTQNGSNTFYYNFTPNVSGTYLASVSYLDSGGTFYISENTFYSQESETMYLTMLFGLLALIVVCFWYARTMASRPLTAVNAWIFDQITTRDFSVIFDLIGGFLLIPLMALLNIWSTGTQYAPIFSYIYIAGVYFVGFTLLAYLIFYLIFRYNEGIQNISDVAHGKRK